MRAALAILAVAYFFVGATSLSVVGLVVEMSEGLIVRESAIAGLVTIFALVYAVSAPVVQATFALADLSETERGSGGFGSTGRS